MARICLQLFERVTYENAIQDDPSQRTSGRVRRAYVQSGGAVQGSDWEPLSERAHAGMKTIATLFSALQGW